MACPFFMPEEQFISDWPFPQRLPLGAGWAGTCTAPGHEGARPSDEELKSGCNLGYAKACSRLPVERHADAVRFALGEERDESCAFCLPASASTCPRATASCYANPPAGRGFSRTRIRACSGWPSAMCGRNESGAGMASTLKNWKPETCNSKLILEIP